MSGAGRRHLDAVTVHFPHKDLHGAASEEVFAKKKKNRQLQSGRICDGLIKASASASAAAPSVQNSISVTSTSSKGGGHVHLNKSVIIPLLAAQLTCAWDWGGCSLQSGM